MFFRARFNLFPYSGSFEILVQALVSPLGRRAWGSRGGSIQHRWWKWAAAGLVVAAVGIGLVWRFSPRVFDWRLAAAALAGLDWRWVSVSLVPVAGSYYVRALRWAVVPIG